MARSGLLQAAARFALIGFLLLLPAVTLWNSLIPPPNLGFYILSLAGVTADLPLTLSARSIIDGDFQKAIASRVAAKIPVRPLLIRLNNQFLYSLFHEIRPRTIAEGAGGELFEVSYLADYCSRKEADAQTYAERMIPILRDIQSFYRARRAVFVYAISPSKVAAMPEYFVGTMPCPSSVATRQRSNAEYAQRLRDAGIATLDMASLVRDARPAFPIALFPRGGTHWNDLGAAIATRAIIDAVNQQVSGQPLQSFGLNYTILREPLGSDRDLINLLALLFPPVSYAVPKLTFNAECSKTPTSVVPAAIVGTSFMHQPVEFLERGACMSDLRFYFYLKNALLGGLPYRAFKWGLDAADLAQLRDMKILVLEENESIIGRSGYAQALRDILMSN
jgi:alginate O-acetyltransferase complex protein AlgJ